MADIVLVALTLAFVAVCVAYIAWCDRIIGPDEFGPDPQPELVPLDATEPVEVTA